MLVMLDIETTIYIVYILCTHTFFYRSVRIRSRNAQYSSLHGMLLSGDCTRLCHKQIYARARARTRTHTIFDQTRAIPILLLCTLAHQNITFFDNLNANREYMCLCVQAVSAGASMG